MDNDRAQDLRTVRALYLFYFAAVGIFFTYINVYYYGLGLSGTRIGLINTVGPLAAIAGTTLWSILNDRFERTRLLLLAAVMAAGASALGLASTRTFVWIVLLASCFSFFSSTIIPLIDGTTLGILGARRAEYGAQRLWGTIGFIVTALAAGPVLDRLGTHTMFGGYALVMGLVFLAGLRLPGQPVRIGGSVWRGLSTMLRRPPWLLFAISYFILGLATSSIMTFLGVTVRFMGGSDTLVGLSWTAAAISEIPIMLYSARLLRRAGPARLLALGIVLYGVRLVFLSLLPAPIWVLPINALLGCSYALTWIGAVAYASELAPAKIRTTSQGLLTAITSLSGMLGATLSGWLFDLLGPAGLFRVATVLCLAALLLFAGGQQVLARGATQAHPGEEAA